MEGPKDKKPQFLFSNDSKYVYGMYNQNTNPIS